MYSSRADLFQSAPEERGVNHERGFLFLLWSLPPSLPLSPPPSLRPLSFLTCATRTAVGKADGEALADEELVLFWGGREGGREGGRGETQSEAKGRVNRQRGTQKLSTLRINHV